MTNHFSADIWAFGVSIYEYELNKKLKFEYCFKNERFDYDSTFTKISERVFDPNFYAARDLDIRTEDNETSFVDTIREMMASRRYWNITSEEISKRFARLDEPAKKVCLAVPKPRKEMLLQKAKSEEPRPLSDSENSEEGCFWEKFISFFPDHSSASPNEKEEIELQIWDVDILI
jgi:hypothetical protein